MSRQAWLDTSSLLESISEYVVRCDGNNFSGLTLADVNGLSNLLVQLSITNGYQTDVRVPLQAMSNSFVAFMSTTDRCGYMLRREWFASDTNPTVSDDFVAAFIKPRMQNPMADIIRQTDYLSLQPHIDLKLHPKQLAIMKGLDTPYNSPVQPCDLFRSTAAQNGNISMMGTLATVPVAPAHFFVAERHRILFGTRSAAAIEPADYGIAVPNWAANLQVTNARLYFTNSFFGTTIEGVQVASAVGDAPTTIMVPTDNNFLTVNSDSVYSFSMSGGNINLTLGVQKTGYCIAIDGTFSLQANRSQNYYTLTSITQPDTYMDDFKLSVFLNPFLTQLEAAGQTEIFSNAMNTLTITLITNYTAPAVAGAMAFDAPWWRFSERAHTILSNAAIQDMNVRKLLVRHLWIIVSLIAVFGRYYRPN
ncbi:capsid protein [Scaphoideus titanus reo-like virus 1]|nr:capsid protein [Scaphoideus titanus reo-like virus 1]